MKTNLRKFLASFLLTLLCGLPFACLAADAAPGAVSGNVEQLIIAIIPLLVPIVIAIVKAIMPSIPTVALPIIAPILGALIDIIATQGVGPNTILGAALGSAGVGLREIVDQVRKAQITKGSLLLLVAVLPLGLMGCSTARQTCTTATDPKTGIVSQTTEAKVYTVIQSSQTIDKVRASNGKTQSLGMSGVDQQSDASKFMDALTAFARTMGEVYASAQTGGLIQPAKAGTTSGTAVAPVVPANAVPVTIKAVDGGELWCWISGGKSNCFFIPKPAQ